MVGVVSIPISIKLDWNRNDNDNYVNRRYYSNNNYNNKRGKVESETITEYRNIDNNISSSPSRNIDILKDFSQSCSSSSSTLNSNRNANYENLSKGLPSKGRNIDGANDNINKLTTTKKFCNEGLETHNKFRRKHGVPPLKLSTQLCNFAQEWADKLARTDEFEHREDNDYGENLFCAWSSDPNADVDGIEPVESWYSEIKNYVFGREPKSMGTGHFTQVIWKESELLGIGKSKSKSGKMIVVANYDPPGNFIGNYVENVPRPIR